MQPMKIMAQWLSTHANEKHYLFTTYDFRALFQKLSNASFKTLLSRATKTGLLIRLCRGIYLYQPALPTDGLLLYHTAALLRADTFNYISLETALSDAGVISQIPINWLTIMTSGRSNIFSCNTFGSIEFIHTKQSAKQLRNHLSYDHRCHMWRADVTLAIRDMKATHRDTDLIDWDIANELI